MFKVEFKGLEKIKSDLETFANQAIPYAMKEALNVGANATAVLWEDEISKRFVLRNKFTARSIQMDRARGLNIRSMRARVGSTADYMAKQESGGTVSKGGHKPIPTALAAGMAPGAARTKPVMRSRWLTAIKLVKVKGGKSAAQRNAVAMAVAKRKGAKFALLEKWGGGGKGIYRITGRRKKLHARQVWDLSHKSVRVRPSPTLGAALRRVAPLMPDIMRMALISQCRRWKIAGY